MTACGFLEFSKRYFGPYIVVKLASLLRTDIWDFLFHHLAEITALSLSCNMVFYLKQHLILEMLKCGGKMTNGKSKTSYIVR